MDNILYEQKQDERQKEFEALCHRCGACCGAETDPCANLVKSADGRYTCNEYDKRLGMQKTISGKTFTCVSIRDVLKKGTPNLSCGYALRTPLAILFIAASVFLTLASAYTADITTYTDETDYRNFKLENCSCDVATLYRDTPEGTRVDIAAIATGKGANFRKWRVTDVKIRMDNERIRPDSEGKFWVREESFWRLPAAVLFAAIGTQIDVGGTGLEKGIAKAGAAIGLGLLAWQAKGDIEGYKCMFKFDKKASQVLADRTAFAEITIENTDYESMAPRVGHTKETIKIGIAKRVSRAGDREKFERMSDDDLAKLIATMGWRKTELEREQGAYKYGVDPEYDRIQFKIEDLETQRAIAYDIWAERTKK